MKIFEVKKIGFFILCSPLMNSIHLQTILMFKRYWTYSGPQENDIQEFHRPGILWIVSIKKLFPDPQ